MRKWSGITVLAVWLICVATIWAAMTFGISSRTVELVLKDGRRIHAVLTEPAPGRKCHGTVIVLHGMAVTHQSCMPGLVVPLAREGYRVLSPDLAGHGLSDGKVPRWQFADAKTLLASSAEQPEVDACIEYLQLSSENPIAKVALVGHSRGGWSAANAGVRREDIGAVVSIGAAPGVCSSAGPRNLLLLTGSRDEVAALQDCIAVACKSSDGEIQAPGVNQGAFEQGTKRGLLVAHWANHFTELGNASITRHSLWWVSLAFGRGPESPYFESLFILASAVLLASATGLFLVWLLLSWAASIRSLSAGLTDRPWQMGRFILALVTAMAAPPGAASLSAHVEIGPIYFAVTGLVVFALVAVGLYLTSPRDGRSAMPDSQLVDLYKGAGLALLGAALLAVFLGVPWGLSWLDLVPEVRRLTIIAVLAALYFPIAWLTATKFARHIGAVRSTIVTACLPPAAWLALPVTLWSGYTLFVSSWQPLFTIPLLFVCVSYVAALPCWLMKPGQRSTVAAAVCQTATAAWLMGCHFPFVD